MGIEARIYRFDVEDVLPGGDASGAILRNAWRIGLGKLCAIRQSDIYFVRGIMAPGELDLLGRFLFSDPVTKTFRWRECPIQELCGCQAIEIAYHPGVTDSVADEIVRAAREIGVGALDAAATGLRYEIFCSDGKRLDSSECKLLASKILANPVIQRYAIDNIEPSFPSEAEGNFHVEKFPVHCMGHDELRRLNESRRAALDPEEMLAISQYFQKEGRPCTDIEFEMIAQTWSEHCVHKTFKALIDVQDDGASGLPAQVNNILHTYIKAATDKIAAPWVRSAFRDNAGIIDFDDEHEISFKVETHNHPSAIEPFGGANTGVGGVIRDILGVSAKPIAVTDVLCFGLVDAGTTEEDTIAIEHIRNGVVAGVQDYGNKMGIPTVNGGIHFHPDYAANPLVYCGCAGIAPKNRHPTDARIGDRIVVIGGRTGRDGIRGATFSSMTMDDSTLDTSGSSVQIGAPLVEKKVSEVVLAARDLGLYSAITDCGAGGLSSAIGEMASSLGADIELSNVPLKYPGLAPWEIWLSEAQERMVLAVPPRNMARLEMFCSGDEVEICDLGSFTGTGRLIVRYKAEAILDLDCDFLHNGIPQRRLFARQPSGVAGSVQGDASGSTQNGATVPRTERLCIPESVDIPQAFAEVLSHHAVASREWAIRLYDHEVQGATRIGPFAGRMQAGPSDAAVLKPLETKGLQGIVISNGFNARYGEADSYNAAISAIDEALRNAVAVGADPDHIALIDNFCWGDPKNPEQLWTLLRAAKGCYDAALMFGAPFVSGKDSFNNEFASADGTRVAIPPSLLISAFGIVPDIGKSVTSDLKKAGNLLYLVGEFRPTIAASVLADIFAGDDVGAVRGRAAKGSATKGSAAGGPGPGLSRQAPKTFKKIFEAMQSSLVSACHDLSDGGLGAALSEMCIGGGKGAVLDMHAIESFGSSIA
ncbi:MAG: phosphoribosylformylglycinamidine synthase subunit PurS, partial [Spirochaetaceae bacterium]|nr:phosphoribosylformylglycinamidine synthase subunit PurS [Spirochaetaceae bacterium]